MLACAAAREADAGLEGGQRGLREFAATACGDPGAFTQAVWYRARLDMETALAGAQADDCRAGGARDRE